MGLELSEEAQKILDKKIDTLDKEYKKGNYAPKTVPRKLPTSDVLWHFHPIGFLEQLERMMKKWHDPVDNPQITIFTKSGRNDPHNSAFGGHRGRPHSGLDIFTPYQTQIHACLNGTVVYTGFIKGYGKTLVIQVNKKDLELSRRNYQLKYDKEVLEGDQYSRREERYLLYAHLDSFKVKVRDKVSTGEVVALSGVTGYAEGTFGPHLHFEISSKKLPSKGDGYKYRTNPLNYFKLKDSNIEYQEKYKQKTYSK